MDGLPKKIEELHQSFQIKREVPRYALSANVEVTELGTGTQTSGRVSEISRKGCYIKISDTLPVDTPVKIVIPRDTETFSTDGKIIYAQDGTGMGVAFQQTAPEQLEILDAWLGASISLCFFMPEETHTN
ncbi:MAG TPA: PilZ domain-containing protein [Candidatus Dormibacteraeota bacterium]|nr:PilZ domain-containing protein [Candidatus Dormibacteraeota bacterium]